MRRIAMVAASIASVALFLTPFAFAGGNLAKQKVIEVRLDLGRDGVGTHRYYPHTLTFETGKLYKLVIHNPSINKHYFTSLGLAGKIYTRKVQVMDGLGKGAKTIGEIKGAIREVEVYPGGTTEWWFVPVATGTVNMRCGIKDKDGKTHAEKGMYGEITIL